MKMPNFKTGIDILGRSEGGCQGESYAEVEPPQAIGNCAAPAQSPCVLDLTAG